MMPVHHKSQDQCSELPWRGDGGLAALLCHSAFSGLSLWAVHGQTSSGALKKRKSSSPSQVGTWKPINASWRFGKPTDDEEFLPATNVVRHVATLLQEGQINKTTLERPSYQVKWSNGLCIWTLMQEKKLAFLADTQQQITYMASTKLLKTQQHNTMHHHVQLFWIMREHNGNGFHVQIKNITAIIH